MYISQIIIFIEISILIMGTRIIMRKRSHLYVGVPHHYVGVPHHSMWGTRIIKKLRKWGTRIKIWRRPHTLNFEKTGLDKFFWFKFILKFNFWSISIDQNQKFKYFVHLNRRKACSKAWCGLLLMRVPPVSDPW